jgi:hypothetical protein
MISLEDEIKSLKIFKIILTEKMKNYSTTLEHDLELINSDEVKKDFKLINIYTVLIEEKQLLSDYIIFVDEILNILKINERDLVLKEIHTLLRRRVSVKYLRSLIMEIDNL